MKGSLGSQRLRVAALGVVVSVACVVVLARRVDGPQLWTALRAGSVGWLALTLVTKAASMLCLTARSRALLGRFGEFSWRGLLRAHVVGFGGNVVLPFRLGEILRIREIDRWTGLGPSTLVGALVVERTLDLLWLAILALLLPTFVAFDLSFGVSVGATIAAVALALLAAAWMARRPDQFGGLARHLGRVFGAAAAERFAAVGERFAGGFAVLASRRRFAAASVWTLLYWASGILGISLWLIAFRVEAPWYASMVLMLFVALGVAVPAAPGFVGTYHLAVVSGLALFRVPAADALAVAVAGHFFSTVPLTLVALLLFFDELKGGMRRPAELPLADPEEARPAPPGERG